MVGDAAGAVGLTFGIACALFEACRSGQGRVVDAANLTFNDWRHDRLLDCGLQPQGHGATELTDGFAHAWQVLRRLLIAVVGTGLAGAGEGGIAALPDVLLEAGGTGQACSGSDGGR